MKSRHGVTPRQFATDRGEKTVYVKGREEDNLRPYFYRLLTDGHAIMYRQEIMRDLEHAGLFGHVRTFSPTMYAMRQ